jgi:quercetin dioxygenase-like cupin family protein
MLRTSSVVALLVMLSAPAPAPAQDPATVAAQECKVAFENEYVRVLHWTIAPHGKVAMHSHPALVSIHLKGGKVHLMLPGGETKMAESTAGQVTWSDAESHAGESKSDHPIELIQVELKTRPGADMTTLAAADDSVKVDPKHYESSSRTTGCACCASSMARARSR